MNNVTLDNAVRAVCAYNKGTYRGGVSNLELDRTGRELFADGLAHSSEAIERQVSFIGRDYGGVAGFPSAIRLAGDIARDIASDRERYERAASSAPDVMQGFIERAELWTLYAPFAKTVETKRGSKRNWLVWATKFWHFLNPNAFPIEDGRVNDFFGMTQSNSAEKYLEFLNRYRRFAESHQSWLPDLRAADGGSAWSDTKLWDKVFYGLQEPALRLAASQ